jgi:Fic family protein
MRSLNLRYLEALRLSPLQASALKHIGEFQGKQALFARQTPEILESMRKVARVESAESSNRIEGVTAPRARVEAIVRDAQKPADRSEQEIAGYRDALEMVHESAEYMALSTHTICQLHSIMYRYLPSEGGEWKHVDNKIIETDADGAITRIRFEPVSAEDTVEAMDTFVRNYQLAVTEHGLEPLVVVPLAILDFLCIHPFTDGNGRMSRLMTLLLLYHFGYQVGRYISLERIVEESKETYYEALRKSSEGWHTGEHDCDPWLNYFWGILIRAFGEFEERVGDIRSKKLSKTEQIRMAVDRRVGPFAISEIESELPHVSREMIKLVLRDLKEEGVIQVMGKGRGAKWIRVAEPVAKETAEKAAEKTE